MMEFRIMGRRMVWGRGNFGLTSYRTEAISPEVPLCFPPEAKLDLDEISHEVILFYMRARDRWEK
jgi:hypothetical protein